MGNWPTALESVAKQLTLKFGFGIDGRCPMRAGGTDNIPRQHCQGDPCKDLLRRPRHCVRIVPAKHERHTMPPSRNDARMGINCGIYFQKQIVRSTLWLLTVSGRWPTYCIDQDARRSEGACTVSAALWRCKLQDRATWRLKVLVGYYRTSSVTLYRCFSAVETASMYPKHHCSLERLGSFCTPRIGL